MADEVARLIAVMETQLRGFTKGMEQAQREADRRFGAIEKRMNKTEKAFGASFAGNALTRNLTRYLSVAAVVAFTNSLLNAADKLADTAGQIGITTQELQEFQYAARVTGGNADAMASSLGFLNDRLGDAAKGEGELAEVMREFNIPMGTAVQVALALADATKNATTQSERARIVTAGFGKAGKDNITFFSQGADAIRAYGVEANRLKQVWDAETVERLNKARDSVDTLQRALVTIAALPASAFIDQLSGFLERLASGDLKQQTEALLGAAKKLAEYTIPGAAALMSGARMLQGGGPQTSVHMDLKPWSSIPGAGGAPVPPKPGDVEPTSIGTPNLTASEMTALADEVFARRFEEWFRNEFPTERVMAPASALPDRVPIDTQDLGELNAEFDDLIDVSDEFRRGLVSVGLAAVKGFGDAGDAIGRLSERLGDLVLEAGLLKAVGWLFGAPGSTGGGFLGRLFAGGKAGGGTIPRGQWGIVGERGPEPIYSGAMGTRVLPNSALRAMPSRGAPSVHITAPVYVSLAGANGDAAIVESARQAAAAGAAMAISTIRKQLPGMMIDATERSL